MYHYIVTYYVTVILIILCFTPCDIICCAAIRNPLSCQCNNFTAFSVTLPITCYYVSIGLYLCARPFRHRTHLNDTSMTAVSLQYIREYHKICLAWSSKASESILSVLFWGLRLVVFCLCDELPLLSRVEELHGSMCGNVVANTIAEEMLFLQWRQSLKPWKIVLLVTDNFISSINTSGIQL